MVERKGFGEMENEAEVSAAIPTRPSINLSPEQTAAVRRYMEFWEGGRSTRHPHIMILLLGYEGVGKRTIGVMLSQDVFLVGYDPTGDERTGMTTYIESKPVRFEGWRESPDPQLSPKTCPYGFTLYGKARHCEVCFLVYDVTNRQSFEAVRSYYDNFCLERSLERVKSRNQCCVGDCPARPPFPGLVFIIANKIDREHNEWTVSMEEGEKFCKSIGAEFMPMSARTGEGSGTKVLLEMAHLVLLRRIQNIPLLESGGTSTGEASKPSKGTSGSRLSRWLSKSARRQVQDERMPESEATLDDKVSTAAAMQSRARNPNELYWY
ncbi:RAS2 protein [Vermiconidia calcicola]|uniref:RAS2 protein n=1 Tax=Vermiconidia calcicola TaxID=1690605 RepID=A0ACC3NPF8_9PEZI|nr:RAS2 protein [Vermiconidia calcicola]